MVIPYTLSPYLLISSSIIPFDGKLYQLNKRFLVTRFGKASKDLQSILAKFVHRLVGVFNAAGPFNKINNLFYFPGLATFILYYAKDLPFLHPTGFGERMYQRKCHFLFLYINSQRF